MPDVKQLRLEYQSCIKLANETDSKKEDAFLRAEAVKLLKQIQDTCPHEEVVILRSYSPSYSSYEDPTSEVRKCLCCNTEESHYIGDRFVVLKAKPFARFESRYPEEVKRPLDYLLSHVVEIVQAQGYAP